MFQAEENTVIDTGTKPEKSTEPSHAANEVVGSLFGQSGLRTPVKIGALALLDGDNPPKILGDDKVSGMRAEAGKGKPPKDGDVNHNADLKHNQEIKNILLNADSILAKHYGEPIKSKVGPVVPQGRPSDSNQSSSRTEQASKEREKAPAEKVPTNARPQSDPADRRAELTRQAQGRLLQEQLSGQLLADLNKRVSPEDLPDTVENSEEAKKYLEYARQNNKKLIMDFSMNGCGYCNQMHNEIYPHIDKSEYVVMEVKREELTQNIAEFARDLGIKGSSGNGNITGFPHTAIFGPGNNYQSAQEEQSGFMKLAVLKGLLNRVD